MQTAEWFAEFFHGVATDLWTQFATPETTAAEVDFFVDVLDLHLSPDRAVLDVPSGNGRHALAMAERGLKVVGVDISDEMLAESAKHASNNLRFERCDMRELKFAGEFEAVLCAGNSFGYFGYEDTMRFFKGVSAALKPEGRFLIDTSMAAESFLVNGGVKEWVEVGDIYMLIENEYVAVESRLDSQLTYLRNGIVEKRTASHYVHTVGEITRMLAASGLRAEEAYCNLDGDPFELGSDRLFLAATKI